MKDYKIGNTKVKICESIEDLNIKRHVAVKQYMIMLETGYDAPELRKMFTDMKNEFDNQKPSGMLLCIYEFIVSLKHVEQMDDADQMIFALITLEKGEEPTVIDKTALKAKLDRYAKAGLKQGEVKEQVANFIRGSIFN